MKSTNSSRTNANNHANQLNPNNHAYWSSRGAPAAPPAPPSPNAAPEVTPPAARDGAKQTDRT